MIDCKRLSRALLVFLAFAGALAPEGVTRAQNGAIERRLRVVARVGSRAITVGELEDRIGSIPPLQRETFGDTVDAVRHRFLTEIVLRDELLAAGAESRRLAQGPPAAYAVERALSAATLRAIRASIGAAASIPMEDVQRYYDENRSRYEAPERYQIWRILCKTREDAQSVLDAAKRDPSPTTFAALARDHSLDKSTNLRSGNLGFVTAEGMSREPGLRVDPSVVRAAQAVRDGALVAEPVAEGEYFSVVWRRGTIAALRRSVGDVTAQIRDAIWKGRVKEETDKLVAALRAEKVRGLDSSLLGTISIPADIEGAMPKARPAGGG